jgi:hypothetical protein
MMGAFMCLYPHSNHLRYYCYPLDRWEPWSLGCRSLNLQHEEFWFLCYGNFYSEIDCDWVDDNLWAHSCVLGESTTRKYEDAFYW